MEREQHINLSTPFEGLDVLCESLVDFENLRRNGVDLTEDLHKQGWETYFNRLYGPIYPLLVKEFWRCADADDQFIVSFVLGVKIVITEASIASLLNMEKAGGKRIYNIPPRSKRITEVINPTIFKANVEGNPSKNKELHQNLRVWLKIILGTIHHRPASNSSDYINADQKCILYCIQKGIPINLPVLLFRYLRDSVRETRNNMKPRSYIPLGRLLSDIFIEHGLVDALEKTRCMDDLAIDVGKPLNAKNLRSMGIIKDIRVKPTMEVTWEALKDQRKMPHGLERFFKNEPRDAIAIYLQDRLDEGIDISDFRLEDCLDSVEDLVRYKRGLSEKKIAEEARKAKKARLGETSGTKASAPLNVSSGKSIPPVSSESIMASSNPLSSQPIYTTAEIPPSITRTSQPPPVLKIARNFTTTSDPNQLYHHSSSSSSEYESPPYLSPSSDQEFSEQESSDQEHSDPNSPTIAEIYAKNFAPKPQHNLNLQPDADSELQAESEPQQTEPQPLNLSPQNSPPHSPEPEPEPELTIPTLEEAIIQVAEASVQKIKSLAKNSEVSDDPKSVRTHWNRVISWMTSESYRLKSISEQVRNGYIRDSEERLQERLAREAEARRLEEERLAREAEEEAKRLEEERLAKEAELLRIQEAEAKAKADAEAQAAAEAEAQQALIQGESSSAIPLILNTLKEIKQDQQEIKKDQNELRARMDKQDALNENIQNMFAMLLQRLPQPPNP
ncbi:hypothetical protein KIW84_050378 [Lathyrus oleraceus]|uniref:Putative plant transposon protein domain-containing protein n=1 Tax=Pisum sativum TaxID=3888 RepID=A0A9D4WH95_PEA|nr:hypothetical protein KIW84_050378 [Pisum sativum]